MSPIFRWLPEFVLFYLISVIYLSNYDVDNYVESIFSSEFIFLYVRSFHKCSGNRRKTSISLCSMLTIDYCTSSVNTSNWWINRRLYDLLNRSTVDKEWSSVDSSLIFELSECFINKNDRLLTPNCRVLITD